MDKTLSAIALTAGLLFGLSASAEPENEMLPPYKGSAPFEALKGLAGQWSGTHQMGGEKTEAKVLYQVTSNGSVLMETLFPGAPHEMVSIYHDEGDKVVMTHYCAFGNQPKMELISSGEGEYNFDFSSDNSLDPATAGHMHALRISMDKEDHLTQNWVMYQEGKESTRTVLELSKID